MHNETDTKDDSVEVKKDSSETLVTPIQDNNYYTNIISKQKSTRSLKTFLIVVIIVDLLSIQGEYSASSQGGNLNLLLPDFFLIFASIYCVVASLNYIFHTIRDHKRFDRFALVLVIIFWALVLTAVPTYRWASENRIGSYNPSTGTLQ